MSNNKIELKEIAKNQTGFGLLIERDGYISMSEGNNQKLFEDIHGGSKDWNIPNPFIVDAVFQKFDIENANGRIYPERILRNQVDIYIDKYINQKCAIGEADHPESSSISTRTISHDILELHWEGRTLMGKLRIITSEGFRRYGVISCQGDQIANLLLNHVKIGVSSRGVGSVEQHLGKSIVGDDFELVCWDIVTQPSTPGAWIAFDKNELKPYVEAKNESNSLLTDKVNKLEKFLM